jgi:hypothetical protein
MLIRFNIFRKINSAFWHRKFPSEIETKEIHLSVLIANRSDEVLELIIHHYHFPPNLSVVTIQILEVLARIYGYHKLTFLTPHAINPAYFDQLKYVRSRQGVSKWIF